MKLHTEGFGATDLDLELGKLNHVTGPNGVGKSKIADAIRFAVLGYVPALGKRPVDTAALLRGREMVVSLELDDGRIVTRKLQRLEDGGHETDCECSWLESSKPTEHHQAAVQLLGTDEADVAECLDIRGLLALTGNKRVARLRELAETASDPEQIADLVIRYTVQRLAEISDEKMPEDHLDALPFVDGFSKGGNHRGSYAELRLAFPMVESKLAETGIEGAIAWVRDEKNANRRVAREKTLAKSELEKEKASLPALDAEEIADVESRRCAIDRELGVVEERRDVALSRRRQVEEAETELAEARTRLEGAETAAAAREWTAEIGLLEEKLGVIDQKLAAPAPESDRSRVEAIEKEITDVDAKLEALAAPEMLDTAKIDEQIAATDGPVEAVLPPAPDTAELDRLIAEGEGDVEPTESSDAALVEARATVKRAEENLQRYARGDWPMVGTLAAEIREMSARLPKGKEISRKADEIADVAGRNFDEAERARLAAVVDAAELAARMAADDLEEDRGAYIRAKAEYDARQKRLAELTSERQQVLVAHDREVAARKDAAEEIAEDRRNARKALTDQRTALLADYQTKKDAYDAESAPLRSRRQELRILLPQARETLRREREGHDQALADLRVERKEIESRIAEARKANAAADAELRAAQHVFDLAQQRRADLGEAPTDADDTTQLEEQLADVNTRLSKLRSIQAKHDELARLVKELDELTARAKVYEALEWACRRASAESLPGGELIARMTAFLRGAGRSEVPYIRVETNLCELGWRGPQGDVAVQVLGGAELALFATALLAAVTTLRGAEVRLLLVEGAECQPESQAQLHAGIESVAGDITAAVTMSWNEAAPLRSGWSRIEISQQAERAAA